MLSTTTEDGLAHMGIFAEGPDFVRRQWRGLGPLYRPVVSAVFSCQL